MRSEKLLIGMTSYGYIDINIYLCCGCLFLYMWYFGWFFNIRKRCQMHGKSLRSYARQFNVQFLIELFKSFALLAHMWMKKFDGHAIFSVQSGWMCAQTAVSRVSTIPPHRIRQISFEILTIFHTFDTVFSYHLHTHAHIYV